MVVFSRLNYCHKNDIRQVDFAKIDLEGHEHKALLGWQNCLQQKIVKANEDLKAVNYKFKVN